MRPREPHLTLVTPAEAPGWPRDLLDLELHLAPETRVSATDVAAELAIVADRTQTGERRRLAFKRVQAVRGHPALRELLEVTLAAPGAPAALAQFAVEVWRQAMWDHEHLTAVPSAPRVGPWGAVLAHAQVVLERSMLAPLPRGRRRRGCARRHNRRRARNASALLDMMHLLDDDAFARCAAMVEHEAYEATPIDATESAQLGWYVRMLDDPRWFAVRKVTVVLGRIATRSEGYRRELAHACGRSPAIARAILRFLLDQIDDLRMWEADPQAIAVLVETLPLAVQAMADLDSPALTPALAADLLRGSPSLRERTLHSLALGLADAADAERQ